MRVQHLEIRTGSETPAARVVVTVESHDVTGTCERDGAPGVYAIVTDDGRDIRLAEGPVAIQPDELRASAAPGIGG